MNQDSTGQKATSPMLRLFGHLFDWVSAILLYGVAFGSIGTETDGGALFGLVLLLGFLVLQIYMMAQSTSLGKRILGLKVYNKDSGEPVGFWMMLVREVIGKALSSLVLGIGFLWILFARTSRAGMTSLSVALSAKKRVSLQQSEGHLECKRGYLVAVTKFRISTL
ncbi:MAG: RDD family protein [Bacillota bacterium]|jgi:uncharacterized RDD family membrane protein YckC